MMYPMGGKKKGGTSVYILAVYIIVLIAVVWLYTFQTRLINHVRDECDSGLLLSLLGAATINVDEYGRTGQRVIHTSYAGEGDSFGAVENADCPDICLEEARLKLEQLLTSNLKLSGEGQSAGAVIVSPVKLEEFKVFNVYTNADATKRQVYEFTWNNGIWSEITHGINEEVSVPGAGEGGRSKAPVEDTTLYAEISFEIALYPYFSGLTEHIPQKEKTRSVIMHRCVSVPEN